MTLDGFFLGCFRFLRETCPDGVRTMKDLGSVNVCVTTAGLHICTSLLCTLTACPI